MGLIAHEVYTKEISLTTDNTLLNVNLVLSFKNIRNSGEKDLRKIP